jgi:pseudouridine-5'-phosphate glycosidase
MKLVLRKRNAIAPMRHDGAPTSMTINRLIDIGAEAAAAIEARHPAVALESTIITHGMPFPQNFETALKLEEAVRSQGATPATIAVVDGRLVVGLDRAGLERLARLSGGVVKASRRDLAAVLARGGAGGTTVAATMYIAALAGLEIFATGGIGGVHRGAAETLDISADLVELSRSKVAVVCAGAKSILDIPKTLEFLESHGVPVIGYRCDEFPAFYARSSGVRLDHRCDGLHDLARMIRLQREIGPGGLIIANPIPEAHALDAGQIEARIEEAVAEAKAQGIGQKDVTPFLLRRLVEMTGGRSLEANMALVEANATLAAQVAVELARL